jgi:protein O-GlcNAc transferase
MDGVALARAGQLDAAATALERATRQGPTNAIYWLNLASVRRRQRRIDEAMRCARRAFELDQRNLLACHLLAELLRHQNRSADALTVLQSLHPDTPRDAQHLLLEGTLQMARADWQAAAVTFLNLLALKPAHIEAYQQLGFAFANLGRHADASECFRTVSLLEPQLCSAIYSAHYSAWACDWAAVASDAPRLAAAMQCLAAGDASAGFSPFCLLSLNDDAASHRHAAAVAARRLAHEARQGAFAGEWQRPDPGPAGYPLVVAKARTRIGFVSADFRTHATSILLVQTLERLDRSRFEVALYSHGTDDKSALRQRLIDAVDEFIDCGAMSTTEQAARIRADGVAILVDLSGFTASSRLGVFALRPAPVQALWLAYPSTTGSDFIDYLIGDPVLTPLAHADDFSERIAQLPVCYEPTDARRERPAPSTRAEAGLPQSAFVYACFNQSYKITEPVFARWCRILHTVPNSVLWLLVPQAHIQAALRAQAVAHGIAPQRLIFAPFVNPAQHLARLPLADLFLDTFPYGAHTTCSDALWMGLPVLTQVGRSFSARVAASLLNAVGLPELAVADEADYERLAVLLAHDAQALHDIRAHLANPLALPLFDNARFTDELGALFARMTERWRAGESPTTLEAA